MGRWIEVALVNNMPDAALESTERQFVELLEAAAGDAAGPAAPCFAARGAARRRCPAGSRTRLLRHRGTLRHAPRRHHRDRHRAARAIAARRALLGRAGGPCRLGRGQRHRARSGRASPRMRPCSTATASRAARLPTSASACSRVAGLRTHALAAGLPAGCRSHIRAGTSCPRTHLRAAGYQILTRSAVAGVDTFVKETNSLCALLPGPSRNTIRGALLREYRRDVGRYLRGERDTYPTMPLGYFDERATAGRVGQRFASARCADRRDDLIDELSDSVVDQAADTAISRRRNACLRQLACATRRAKAQIHASGSIGVAAFPRRPRRSRPHWVRPLRSRHMQEQGRDHMLSNRDRS